jgi:hypothetical protein
MLKSSNAIPMPRKVGPQTICLGMGIVAMAQTDKPRPALDTAKKSLRPILCFATNDGGSASQGYQIKAREVSIEFIEIGCAGESGNRTGSEQ